MSPNLPSPPPDQPHQAPSSPLASSRNDAPQLLQNVTECNTPPSETSPLNPPPASPSPHLPTTPSPHPPSLSDRQLNAIPLILAGLPDTAIAAQLGVARVTIHRWRHHNPDFIARLNLERHHRHAATADRYDRLLNRDMDIIESAQDGDHLYTHQKVRLATSLLSTGRRSLAPTPGPTNPSDILQSLLSQGLPPDTSPDDPDPTTPRPGGAQGVHEGGYGGVHTGSTGGARGVHDPLQITPPAPSTRAPHTPQTAP